MSDEDSYKREGFGTLTAEIVVRNSLQFMEFCMSAFDAVATEIVPGPNKAVLHATLRIGDTQLFVADESWMAKPTRSNIFLYVPNADIVFDRAIRAGAQVSIPMADMPWGDRWGMVFDDFGNYWQIATHREDVSPEEIGRRLAAAPPSPPSDSIEDVIKTYFKCMNEGRWDEYASLFAEDVIMDEQMAGHNEGIEHVREAIGMLQRLVALPNFNNELLQILVDEDRDHAVALWHMRLNAPDGTLVDCRGANFYWVQDGKIRYMRNFHDTVPYLPLFPGYQGNQR